MENLILLFKVQYGLMISKLKDFQLMIIFILLTGNYLINRVLSPEGIMIGPTDPQRDLNGVNMIN